MRLVHLHPPVELAELRWIEPIQVRRDALRGAAARREGARRVPADEVVVRLARAVEFLLARAHVVDAAAQRDVNWSTISTITVLQLRLGHGAVVLRFREVERRFRFKHHLG